MVDAIMFDIDDTLIRTDGSPIEEMISLLRRSKMAGYRIVIITARPGYPENVKWTKRQLATKGIMYDELYFCPPNMKSLIKRRLGYNFLLSVGDQPTDLTDSQNYINTSIFCRNQHNSRMWS